jgi:hypothetical protein
MHKAVLIAAAVTLSAAGAFAAQTKTFRIHAQGVDPTVASQIHADLVRAEQRIQRLFGGFRDTVSVRLFGDRVAFTEALRAAWGIPSTACWMVGGADDHVLYLLSPAAWEEEACEHEDDPDHVRRLVTHELAHVFHGQTNPSADLGELEEIGWFIEGFATWVSGQLDAEHAHDAAEAIAAGVAPARLADAWSGRYRYGVAGSMVAFIEDAWGRPALRALLTSTSQEELLRDLQLSEEEFLARWARWVTG